jgi:hypothetical protein
MKRGWKNIIKVDFKLILCEYIEWDILVQVRAPIRASVNTVTNPFLVQ